MTPTRITYAELEADFELYIDRAADGEEFVFEHQGRDFLLLPTIEEPTFPNRLMG